MHVCFIYKCIKVINIFCAEHYPAAHAIHRVRSAEASNGYDSTLGLSLDPDFFPPNPLHGMYVRIIFRCIYLHNVYIYFRSLYICIHLF